MSVLTAVLRATFLAVGIVGLSACSSIDIRSAPISVVPTDATQAVGLDVFGVARANGMAVPSYQGTTAVEIRTFHKAMKEFAGARCELDSGFYRAEFLSPANVIVPNFGAASPSVFVACTAPGLFGSDKVDIGNATLRERESVTTDGSLWGIAIVALASAFGTDHEYHEYKYFNDTGFDADIGIYLR